MKKWIIIGVIVILLGAAVGYASTFSLDTIEVNGCVFSSEKAVEEAVMANCRFNNTIELFLMNKFKEMPYVPFVSTVDLEFVNKNEVNVTVYEKAIAGCIGYMDGYVYFDNDGNVLESSKEQMDKVPCISGLKFERWEMGERLPINDEKKFSNILTMTQLIEKYELDIKRISFVENDEIVIWHDDIKILLGNGDNLAVQMMNLGSILEGLSGKKGVLYMKDFNSSTSRASFKEKQ